MTRSKTTLLPKTQPTNKNTHVKRIVVNTLAGVRATIDERRGLALNLTRETDTFIYYAVERCLISKRRTAGLPLPWSQDEILQSAKFTNVFRIQ
jgi:hypothetical protein